MPARTLAYFCFAYVSLVILLALLISALPLDFATVQGLGMLIGIPAALSGFVCMLVGIVVTISRAREWPLMAMSLSFVVLAAILAIAESFSTEQLERFRRAIDIAGIGCALVVVLLSARWLTLEGRTAWASRKR